MASIPSSNLTGNPGLDREIRSRGLEGKWRTVMLVLTGKTSVTAAAQEAGVSRQTVHRWLKKFVLGALMALEDQKPGPRVDWEAKCQELERENRELKRQIRQMERANAELQAAVTFLTVLLTPLLGGLDRAYRRFSARDKWMVLAALDKLLAEGGTIMGFSHVVHKAYSTLLRWRKLVRGKTEEEALKILADKTAPHPQPGLAPEVHQAITACHERFPHWGAKQIAHHLEKKQGFKVSSATVQKVLKQQHPGGSWDKKRREKLHTFGLAGLVFCLDHAAMALGQAKAQVLLLLDETSRFILGFSVELSKSTENAVDLVRAAIDQYGRPLLVKTDNAPEFRQEFRALIGALGLFHLNSPYYYAPFNGKLERVIRELRNYLKFQPPAATLAELVAQIAAWVYEHNFLRCHEGLGWLTPAEVLLEKKEPTLPEYVERVRLRQEEGRVVLKFQNRRNQPARLELTLPEAA